jgi:hypothetical protein
VSSPDAVLDPARVRRQAALLLAVINVLTLAIGIVVSVDLRRLATPGGTALRWVEAAVFGDCGDYLGFSVPDPAAVVDSRTPDQVCHDLRAATAGARDDQLRIGLDLGATTGSGVDRQVAVTLTRDGRRIPLQVHLVHRQQGWRVLRDAATCASVGCA